MTPPDAIILAGGRAQRLGGRSKPLLEVAGRTLLDRVLEAASGIGSRTVVVVGPPELAGPGVTVVREDPPYGGPVAALAAALPLVSAADVLLLAVDLVNGGAIAERLAVTPVSGDGVCLVDTAGRRQWLAGRYRADALRSALAALPHVQDAALRRALAPLDITELAVSDELVRDIDTPEDLEEPWRPTTS
ncbi:molybdopterin-guanine dinucleotide biosynthesis protein [Aeromicrobium camelliae]|uniref:Molybdopterin-guanine dinucleotide biosynthesis protein n=1 Tax=Aeromicrobium camelliae TaxID=1538144 RepID=A0A3N6YIN2_9ACTN|nr:NTP transferase domain-containing protein [Aeromicrobium camelliae]RQN09654.1 molybdopterin-guanine dinucleotide biosynthesis protein [Aeromicrobium camelliae]